MFQLDGAKHKHYDESHGVFVLLLNVSKSDGYFFRIETRVRNDRMK